MERGFPPRSTSCVISALLFSAIFPAEATLTTNWNTVAARSWNGWGPVTTSSSCVLFFARSTAGSFEMMITTTRPSGSAWPQPNSFGNGPWTVTKYGYSSYLSAIAPYLDTSAVPVPSAGDMWVVAGTDPYNIARTTDTQSWTGFLPLYLVVYNPGSSSISIDYSANSCEGAFIRRSPPLLPPPPPAPMVSPPPPAISTWVPNNGIRAHSPFLAILVTLVVASSLPIVFDLFV